MTVAPRGRSPMLALSAAGFIATRTSGASPGVMMSWSAKCSWKLDTPGSVPAGARISAGKFGSVDRSLPKDAVSCVKRSPVSCMPSPESPANRMITRSRRSTFLVAELADLLDEPPRPAAAQVASAGRRRGAERGLGAGGGPLSLEWGPGGRPGAPGARLGAETRWPRRLGDDRRRRPSAPPGGRAEPTQGAVIACEIHEPPPAGRTRRGGGQSDNGHSRNYRCPPAGGRGPGARNHSSVEAGRVRGGRERAAGVRAFVTVGGPIGAPPGSRRRQRSTVLCNPVRAAALIA